MSFIKVNALTKQYHMGNNTVSALRGVSMKIAKGERVFLGGPSGSGKSTLLHILGCLDRYHGGKISIAGQDLTQARDKAVSDFRARNIGFVFQNFNLMPVLNVYENVQYPLLLNRAIPAGQRRQRIEAILESVGLADHAKHYPNELSGGQRQRVAIARALVHEPQLLIADEPTANLDSATGEATLDLMLKLSKSHGSTVIICTHNPELLKQAERCVMLRDGQVTDDSAKPSIHLVEREKAYAGI